MLSKLMPPGRFFCTGIILVSLFAHHAHAQSNLSDSEVNDLISEIVADVIDRTLNKTEEVIRRETGVILKEEVKIEERRYEPLPDTAPQEVHSELAELDKKHNRKLKKLKRELNRKLHKARMEFEREAAREKKSGKIRKKRHHLKKKVDKAYHQFDEGVKKANREYRKEREKLFADSRGDWKKGKKKRKGKKAKGPKHHHHKTKKHDND